MDDGSDVGERLTALLDALGIERANVAVGTVAEQQLHALAQARPAGLASVVYVLPNEFDGESPAAGLSNLAGIFRGNAPPNQVRVREMMVGVGADIVELPDGYAADIGSDFIADHPDLVVETITRTAAAGLEPVRIGPSAGSVAGIHYQIEGRGAPLLLFPVGLAPTQWDAVLDALRQQFTLVRLGGPHLGVVQLLESRASNPGYLWGVRAVLARLAIQPGERILEVGAGSGALARDLARQTAGQNPIVAADINVHFLAEARLIAREEGLEKAIEFESGNAERLPFDDANFDVVFTSTVLEECDADQAIRELHRVLKPGGRAAVIVRGIDLPRYWHLNLDAALTEELMRPIGRFGPVAAKGIADASLYGRFAQVFERITPCPFWAVMTPPPPYQVAATAGMLEPDQAKAFRRTVEAGEPHAFQATPHHGVVGYKAAR